MQILIYGSNPRLESGMGKVGREMAVGLARRGHDVHMFAPNAIGPPEEYPPHAPEDDQFTLYGMPNPGGPGVNLFQRHLHELLPDLVLTNRNWQSLDWMADENGSPMNSLYMNQGRRTPVLYYGPPIEAEDKPPMFEQMILEGHMNDCFMVPYTENRYEAMRDEWGVENYLLPGDHPGAWVPHGIDHSIFNPEAAAADAAPGLRQGLGLGDRFVVTLVGENWRRKNLDLLMDAWYDFRNRVLEDGGERPFLMLHTDPAPSRGDDQFYSGWNVVKTAFGYGLNVATSTAEVSDQADVVCTKPHVGAYQPREVVAGHLAAADLMCLPTSGEGFSLTSLEAMACGCPILQTDLPTLRWLCGEASMYVDTVQEHAINTGETMATPSVEHLAEQLYWLYNDPDRREQMAEAGIERADDFTWKRMADGLDAAVETVGGGM